MGQKPLKFHLSFVKRIEMEKKCRKQKRRKKHTMKYHWLSFGSISSNVKQQNRAKEERKVAMQQLSSYMIWELLKMELRLGTDGSPYTTCQLCKVPTKQSYTTCYLRQVSTQYSRVSCIVIYSMSNKVVPCERPEEVVMPEIVENSMKWYWMI